MKENSIPYVQIIAPQHRSVLGGFEYFKNYFLKAFAITPWYYLPAV